MQRRPDHGLRLVPLRHRHRFESVMAGGHVGEASDEVDEVRPLQQELRHPGVVVVILGGVTAAAALRLATAHRVRHVRIEGLAAVAGRGDRRLLDVDALPLRVGRADHQSARRTYRRDLVALGRAVHAEHERVGADDLRVVGRVVARGRAFIVLHRAGDVLLLRQMAARARRHPRRMTGVAGHLGVAVRHSAGGVLDRLRVMRLLVVARMAGRDGVLDLNHFPLHPGIDHRALEELAVEPEKATLPERRRAEAQIGAAVWCSRSRGT